MQDHPKAKHAMQCIQCKPIGNCDNDGLVHINCADGWCEQCLVFQLPKIESELTVADPLISLQSHEKVSICSVHTTLTQGATECVECNKNREGELKGKLSKRTKLIHNRSKFLCFFNDHYLPSLRKIQAAPTSVHTPFLQ